MVERKPLLQISSTDGIEMNVESDDSIKMNADRIEERGTRQRASGTGTIQKRAASELYQEENEMTAEGGGLITNEIRKGGSLRQIRNTMSARKKGEIVNRVISSKTFLFGIVITLGVIADFITLATAGEHFWELLF